MSELVLSLPFPVSVNAMYRAVKGRSILSEDYRAWKREAGELLNVQRHKPITGPVLVNIDLVPPDKRRHDCDNLCKGLVDLLVAHGVIEADDNRILRGLSVYWRDEGIPCRVTVTPLAPVRGDPA